VQNPDLYVPKCWPHLNIDESENLRVSLGIYSATQMHLYRNNLKFFAEKNGPGRSFLA